MFRQMTLPTIDRSLQVVREQEAAEKLDNRLIITSDGATDARQQSATKSPGAASDWSNRDVSSSPKPSGWEAPFSEHGS